MRILFAILLLSFVGCSDHRIIEPTKRVDLKETQLGESGYYLKLPSIFALNIAQGKEGQRSYSFYPGDSLFPSIDIEIKEGQRLGDKITDWGAVKEKVESSLMNHKTTWTIFETETGNFIGQTFKPGIWIEVHARYKNEIDSLISFTSTLYKK